jgi:hypothetical protein
VAYTGARGTNSAEPTNNAAARKSGAFFIPYLPASVSENEATAYLAAINNAILRTKAFFMTRLIDSTTLHD